jgi:hypothetical protein
MKIAAPFSLLEKPVPHTIPHTRRQNRDKSPHTARWFNVSMVAFRMAWVVEGHFEEVVFGELGLGSKNKKAGPDMEPASGDGLFL